MTSVHIFQNVVEACEQTGYKERVHCVSEDGKKTVETRRYVVVTSFWCTTYFSWNKISRASVLLCAPVSVVHHNFLQKGDQLVQHKFGRKSFTWRKQNKAQEHFCNAVIQMNQDFPSGTTFSLIGTKAKQLIVTVFSVVPSMFCNGYCSCARMGWPEERKFWLFEAVAAALGFGAYTIVLHRRKLLEKQLMDRVHKQVAAGV